MPKATWNCWVLSVGNVGTFFQNKVVSLPHFVVLQEIGSEGEVLKDNHKNSDVSMLDFLKSKPTPLAQAACIIAP